MPTRFLIKDYDFKDLKEETAKNQDHKATALKEIRKKFT